MLNWVKRVPRVSALILGALVILAILPQTRNGLIWYGLAFATYCLIKIAFLSKPAPVATPETSPVNPEPDSPDFKSVLRAMPDPVMIISGYEPSDLAGRWVIFANEAAMALYNMRTEGGLLVSYVRNPEVLEAVDEALFAEAPQDICFETTGAQTQYWRAFTTPLPTEDSFKKLALLVIRDETNSRRMERMRADFLANASHELRSPLASLIGFIETLRGHAKDDAQMRDKFLAIMAAQADRMGRLISDLLSLSRIEMNEHVPPTGEADVVHIVHEVAEGLSLLAAEKHIGFDVSGPVSGQFPVMGDRDQIMQVIQNLVDNALKYAPFESRIEIEIAVNQSFSEVANIEGKGSKLILLRPDRDRHDHYMKIRICDYGPGIKREFLPRLAERFYRVEGQKSGDRLGTGLGLAIVKHIINRHRGALVVESVSAHDPKPELQSPSFTAFTVFLPQNERFTTSGTGPRLVIDRSKASGLNQLAQR